MNLTFTNIEKIDNDFVNEILSKDASVGISITFNNNRVRKNNFWQVLNEELLKQRSGIKIIFSHLIDCNWKDISFLKYLNALEYLSINEFDLENIEPLYSLDLKGLYLSINPEVSLQFLSHFQHLQDLGLYWNQKNIEVISELKNLRKLSLGSLKLENINFIENSIDIEELRISECHISDMSSIEKLKQLKSLYLSDISKLKNVKFFNELTNTIETLCLSNIRLMKEIDFISKLNFLQYLSLNAIPVKSLPDFKNCQNLKRISLKGMRKLEDIATLAQVKSLEVFYFGNKHNFTSKDFFFLASLPNLSDVNLWFRTINEEKEFREIHKIDCRRNIRAF